MASSMNWVDGPGGGTPISAANLAKLMVTADAGAAGTPTGDTLRAIYGLSVATTATASATLLGGKFTPVDATAAARTMTLPAGAADGVTIGVEKIDASVNVVSVTGSIRGVPATTLILPWQHETLLLRADSAGSWWPVAGHKTKASLDSTYSTAVNHGAVTTVARPTGAATVLWIGTVQPNNMTSADAWVNPSPLPLLNRVAAAESAIASLQSLMSSLTPPTGAYPVFGTLDQAVANANPTDMFIVSLPDTTAPATPTGTTETIGSGQGVLDWADNTETDMAYYEVQYGTVNPPTAGPVTATISTLTLTGLTNGTTYYWRVRAVDLSGNRSAYTTVRSFVPTLTYVPLSKGLVHVGAGSTSVTVQLQDNSANNVAPTPGNTLIAWFGTGSVNTDQVTPSGWTKVDAVGTGTSGSLGCYYHTVGSSESGSYTFSVSTAGGTIQDLSIAEWQGALAPDAAAVKGSSGTGVTTTGTLTSAATTGGIDLVLAAVHTGASSGGFNGWSGLTLTQGNTTQQSAYLQVTGAGATPSSSDTWITARPGSWMLTTWK